MYKKKDVPGTAESNIKYSDDASRESHLPEEGKPWEKKESIVMETRHYAPPPLAQMNQKGFRVCLGLGNTLYIRTVRPI